MWQIILLSLLSSLQLIITFPLVILHLLKIQAFRVSDKSEINGIVNKLKIAGSSILSNEKPEGFIYGKWYLGFISVTTSQNGKKGKTLYILIKKYRYEEIKKTINDDDDDEEISETEETKKDKKNIKIWFRRGNYFWIQYISRMLNVEQYYPRNHQEAIIDDIVCGFKKIKVVMLYGLPGSGKSMIPILTTKKFNGNYCTKWNPTEPGDTLSALYSEIMPSKKKPLILVLEEFDGIIDKLGNIQPHKHIPIEIRNKTGWNGLLDELQMKIYPYIILFLISNKAPDYINKQDTSYIRKGRVDNIYEVRRNGFSKMM